MYATEVPVFASVLQVPLLYFFEDEINPDDIDHALLLECTDAGLTLVNLQLRIGDKDSNIIQCITCRT